MNNGFFDSSCDCKNKALTLNGTACVDPGSCGANTATLKTASAIGSYGREYTYQCICDNGFVVNPDLSGCIPLADCNSSANMKLTNDYKCVCEDDATLNSENGQVTCQKNQPDPAPTPDPTPDPAPQTCTND